MGIRASSGASLIAPRTSRARTSSTIWTAPRTSASRRSSRRASNRGDVMYQIRSDQEAGRLGGALLRIAGTRHRRRERRTGQRHVCGNWGLGRSADTRGRRAHRPGTGGKGRERRQDLGRRLGPCRSPRHCARDGGPDAGDEGARVYGDHSRGAQARPARDGPPLLSRRRRGARSRGRRRVRAPRARQGNGRRAGGIDRSTERLSECQHRGQPAGHLSIASTVARGE